MSGGDDQLLHEVLFARAHALAAGAAAALLAIGGDRRALQIAGVRDRYRHLLIGYQIFQRKLDALVGDGRTTFVAVLFLDLFEFLDDYVAQLFLRGEDALVVCDALANFCQFFEDFLGREPRQAIELQIENRVCLLATELAG